jgi:hypothetical protein
VAACGVSCRFKFIRSMEPNVFDRFNKLLSSPDRRPELGGHAGEPTVIYDVRGRVVATLSTDQIPLEEVADPMWQVTSPLL